MSRKVLWFLSQHSVLLVALVILIDPVGGSGCG